MIEAFVTIVCLLLPLAVGWLYGRDDVDPYTARGRRHYQGHDE